MRLRYLLAVASVLTLASQGLAQGCEGWNTREFFKSATLTQVRGCLTAGADVNAQEMMGNTPLHYAVTYADDPAIVRALLDAGADVNARNKDGKTPWDYAKDNLALRDTDAYRRLAERSVAAAAECEGWNTPDFFTWVATPEKVADCLAAGARVDVRSEHGFTPLHFAAAHSGKVASIYGPAVIRTLIQAGAWVGARSSGGLTPLHFAAGENENPPVITALVRAGAQVNARDERGLTPLHLAALYSDNPAIITALVEAGASVNARGDSGLTPLHFAAGENENPAVITALLDVGADATVQDNSSNTPWDYAQDNEALRGTDVWWRLNEGRFQ